MTEGVSAELTRVGIIHILGASGSGTTTLGHAISERHGHVHLDVDDYFWLPTDPPYTTRRKPEERRRLLARAISEAGRAVVTGSLCGWGDVLVSSFELVIFVDTPAPVRLERLKEREYRRFGKRILPCGDMHAAHVEFLAWAARYDTAGPEQRSRAEHRAWVAALACPVITVDGAQNMDAILHQIERDIAR